MIVGFRTFLVLVLFASLLPALGQDLQAQGGRGKFDVRNHFESGGALVFQYYAPYSGLTKVKLFDGNGNLIWRGQYIDPEGDNELRLRAEHLERGMAYVFQFEYKLDLVRVPVTLD